MVNVYQIGKNYVLSDFKFDLALACIFLANPSGEYHYFLVTVIIKLPTLYDIMNKIVSQQNLSPKKNAIFQLFKLILLIIIMIHYFGCGFILVSNYEHQSTHSQNNWIDYFHINRSSVLEQ